MSTGEGIASAVGSLAVCALLGLWLYLSHVETMAKMAAASAPKASEAIK